METVPLYVAARADPVHNVASVHLLALVLQDVLEHFQPPAAPVPRPTDASRNEFGAVRFTLHQTGRISALAPVEKLQHAGLEQLLMKAIEANGAAGGMPLILPSVGTDSMIVQIGFRVDTTGLLVFAPVAAAEAEPLDQTPVVVKRRVLPRYPMATGNIVLKFVVDTAGHVDASTLRVLSYDNPALIQEARQAVRRWEFHPATVRGCPVRQWVQVPITFAESDW